MERFGHEEGGAVACSAECVDVHHVEELLRVSGARCFGL